MPKYGMVIDLQKCVGCGACALSCKTENNTPDRDRAHGQTFNWADFIHRTEGKFPKVTYATIPVLCNHCTDAPCVKECPVTPKAMYKDENGITMTNNERCIGCRSCQEACPYSAEDVNAEKAEYSVISFNESDPHALFRSTEVLIKGITTSGAEIAEKAGDTPPHRTLYEHADYRNVRTSDVIEKCTFCAHRLKKGQLPTCVVACPATARVFGDLDDPTSEVSKLLKKHKSVVLKPEAGTRPNVHYIRSFRPVSKS